MRIILGRIKSLLIKNENRRIIRIANKLKLVHKKRITDEILSRFFPTSFKILLLRSNHMCQRVAPNGTGPHNMDLFDEKEIKERGAKESSTYNEVKYRTRVCSKTDHKSILNYKSYA